MRRTTLEVAAANARLAPWQREFMLAAVRGAGASGSEPLATAGGPGRPAAAGDGAWAGIAPPSTRWLHAAIYDPVRDRMVVFGGQDESGNVTLDDVWTLTFSETPAWRTLAPAGTGPSRRYGHVAIYDPVRDRMLVFGGYDGTTVLGDVWALSLSGSPAWTQLAPQGGPIPPRALSAVAYDSARDRMLVFGGGNDFTTFNDAWALTLAGTPAWTELTPTGNPPSPRNDHAAIYDPVRDRLVTYGGYGSTSFYGDVWSLALAGSTAWTQLAPSGSAPIARAMHTAIYDPAGDRMLVFGGYTTGGMQFNDAWSMTLTGSPVWSAVTTTGSAPVERIGHTAVHDPARGRMIVFGGTHLDAAAWALSLSATPAWTEVAPAGSLPGARANATTIYDPVRDRMIVYGGYTVGNPSDETWARSLSGTPSWNLLAPAGDAPPPRTDHVAIYDPVRDRMVIFGGYGALTPFRNDTWAFSLSGVPTWTELQPAGPLPGGRSWSSAIYDPVRDRMLVFGGSGISPALDDVWALSLAGPPAWTQLMPAGSPPGGRWGHTAVYDPVRDRMLVFGGTGTSRFNDVWALSLSGTPAWTALAPAASPPAGRYLHTAIFDPVRDRMVVFAGYDGTRTYADVWALSLSGAATWTALAPAGVSQFARSNHATIYDPARDRMIVFGGNAANAYRSDAWALEWGQPLAPTVSCPGDVVWTTGASSDLGFGISNPHGFAQIADYTLASAREWPGFPIAGSVTVAAGGTTTVHCLAPVPDSAANGLNRLTFRYTLRGIPQSATCWLNFHDATTPALVSLVDTRADRGRVRLTWYAAGGGAPEFVVQRRTAGTAWLDLDRVHPDGAGYVCYEDTQVSAGTRYGYRLVSNDQGSAAGPGETWVEVPGMNTLSLPGARPNPASREFTLVITLPDASPARLEILDLAGRRVLSSELGMLGPGTHEVRVERTKSLAPGVYLVRLWQGARAATARVVMID